MRIDAAGNLHARHASIAWDETVWLSGSHIDSVPTGGDAYVLKNIVHDWGDDKAVQILPALNTFLQQTPQARCKYAESVASLLALAS